MNALRCEGLCFSYQLTEALRGITFGADYGEMLCVLGKNGAGKTTLFRCLLGFLAPRAGHIYIDDKERKTYSAKEAAAKIAYIPQARTETFNYDCLLVVMMGFHHRMNAFRGPGKADEEAALETMESLGIAHFAHKGFAALSGGERQMVLIARALAQGAGILILDEPFANLDYENSRRLLDTLHALSSEQRVCVVMSTHENERALRVADRVFVMRDGRGEIMERALDTFFAIR